MDYIESTVTFQQFRGDLLPIFSDGDLQAAYNDLLYVLSSNMRFEITGEPVTWQLILNQYSAHIAQWNFYFKKSEASGYHQGKDRAKRLEIQQFIEKRAWNKDYIIHKGSSERDEYLFGKLPVDNLKYQLNAFRQKFHKV